MTKKRADKADHSLVLIFLVAAVAMAGMYSMTTNKSFDNNQFVIVEYLEELNEDQLSAFTGNVIAETPSQVKKLMQNEPPSKENYRIKYGCYKRCHCSYADTCQCEYGGCIRVGGDDEPKVKEDFSHGVYKRSSEKYYYDKKIRVAPGR
jgi:hypothetical protein